MPVANITEIPSFRRSGICNLRKQFKGIIRIIMLVTTFTTAVVMKISC